MKRLLSLCFVLVSYASLVAMPQLVCTNSDDIVFGKPVPFALWQKDGGVRHTTPSKAYVVPPLGQDGLVIASLCASSSSSVVQSRANAMGGLSGEIVPMSPANDPTAWNVFDPNNFQWWHSLHSLDFYSWMGKATNLSASVSQENGHRLVIHVIGTYPVGDYYGTISSTLASVSPVTYPIGTNSSDNTEIPFNVNFAGINRGPNGRIDSFYDPSRGAWVVGGDDTVYTNGELPSQVPYTDFVRFGATFEIDVKGAADWPQVTGQFMSGGQTFTATLRKGSPAGPIVASETLSEPGFRLNIARNGAHGAVFWISQGQDYQPYTLFSAADVENPQWVRYPNQVFLPNAVYVLSGNMLADGQMFFRAQAGVQ